MGIGLVYPKFAAHRNLLLLLQIKFIRFSLYKVNIGCPQPCSMIVIDCYGAINSTVGKYD